MPHLLLCLLLCVLTLGCGTEDLEAPPSGGVMSDAAGGDVLMTDSVEDDGVTITDTMAADDATVADNMEPEDTAMNGDGMMGDVSSDAFEQGPDGAWSGDAMPGDDNVTDTLGDAEPESPTGPIPPPEGADPTPEGDDFDWSDVGSTYLSPLIPTSPLDWSSVPKYGSAQVLAESDSDGCVCFDVDCATCSQDTCSAATCTYDLNADHTLTKYHVALTSLSDDTHVVTFEVNVSADPPIAYTTIALVLDQLERIPVAYWHGLDVITQFGRGIQFLHGSYFNGAAAYGSMNYIDTQTTELPTLLHELGHTFEQYTRLGNPPLLEPQANILDPVWRHVIRSDDNRTSWYGEQNEWEDLAEFARLYATAMIEGSLPTLESLSPERFRVWHRILLNGATIAP